MKKILVYYDSMAAKGGVERVIANLFNSLTELYDITLLTSDDAPSAYYLSNRIKRKYIGYSRVLDMKKSRTYRIWQIISSLIRNIKYLKQESNKYDYIYVATHLNALEVFLCGKQIRERCVVGIHDSYYAANYIYQIIKKIIYPKMYRIVSPTTTDQKRYAADKCKSIYIPHLSTFSPRKSKGFNKIALNVGRLTMDKQQDILIQIWNDLYKKNKLNGWKLRIVGEGELHQKLEDYITQNNLNNSIILTGKKDNISDEYENADLFLFTSRMEGFGMALLEAMSFSIPCISFDCDSGPRDLIIDNENGFLIPCFDISKYEVAIVNLIENEAKLKVFSSNAYEFVEKWDNNAILEEWKQVFN